jgi:hypothetical protein
MWNMATAGMLIRAGNKGEQCFLFINLTRMVRMYKKLERRRKKRSKDRHKTKALAVMSMGFHEGLVTFPKIIK